MRFKFSSQSQYDSFDLSVKDANAKFTDRVHQQDYHFALVATAVF